MCSHGVQGQHNEAFFKSGSEAVFCRTLVKEGYEPYVLFGSVSWRWGVEVDFAMRSTRRSWCQPFLVGRSAVGCSTWTLGCPVLPLQVGQELLREVEAHHRQ